MNSDAEGSRSDEGVAAGDGDREHPQRHHRREIERRDAGDHAQRRVFAPAVDIAADVHRVLALEQMRNAAGEFHYFQTAGDFALRIRQDLAMLGGDDRGQIACVAFQQFLELEHHPRAIQRRGVGPGRECGGGGIDGGADIIGRCQRHASGDLAGGGIEDVGIAVCRFE